MNIRKILVLGIALISSSHLLATDSYNIIELGDLGASPTYVYDVNNNDIAAGASGGPNVDKLDVDGNQLLDTEGNVILEQDFTSHGFMYENLVMSDLGAINNGFDAPASSDFSVIHSINDNNIAAGYSIENVVQADLSTLSFERAIYIDANNLGQAPVIIPDLVLGDPKNMRALSNNLNNVVVGFSFFNPVDDTNADGDLLDVNLQRGFIYDTINGVMVRVDPLVDLSKRGFQSSIRAINNSDIAVGWSQKLVDDVIITMAISVNLANPVVTELNLFSDANSFAWAINNNGKIVGKAVNVDKTAFVAFIHDINSGNTTDLGVLNEVSPFSEALDINDNDQVVGFSTTSVFPTRNHAFIYDAGVMKDLNDMIDCKVDPLASTLGTPDWLLHSANSINNNGVIVGTGLLNGVLKSYMLTPRNVGELATSCQSPAEEDSGGGSFSIFMLFLLAYGWLMYRDKLVIQK